MANDNATPPVGYDASNITVLEGLEAVRKRPGMYIGSTGERGLHHLVYEVVDNAVDEALAGYCDTIEVTLLADGGVRVDDNGRGIPVDIVESEGKPAVEVVLTVLHAGGKFGGGGYAVSGGLHGVGVSVVNALSRKLAVEVRRQGHVWRQEYADGVPQAPLTQDEPAEETGTVVTFWPNGDIFETTEFDFETLRSRFQQMAFLNKGLRITLTDERPEHTGTDDEVTGAETREAEGIDPTVTGRVDVFGVALGSAAKAALVPLLGQFRRDGIRADMAYGDRGLKGAFKAADRSGTSVTIVIGEDELAAGTAVVKNMADGEQHPVPLDSVVDHVRGLLDG